MYKKIVSSIHKKTITFSTDSARVDNYLCRGRNSHKYLCLCSLPRTCKYSYRVTSLECRHQNDITYLSQFHIPTTLSPRDRGFAYPGVRQTVKVDHTKLVDTLEENSIYPCNKSLNGIYDECAYREVGTKVWRWPKLEKAVCLLSDQETPTFKTWLHSTLDGPATHLPSK